MIDHEEAKQPSRRLFLGGLTALMAAPMIVRVHNLMPVKSIDLYDTRVFLHYNIYAEQFFLRVDRALWQMKRPDHGVWNVPLGVAKKLMPARAFTTRPPEGAQWWMDRLITLQEFAAVNYDPHAASILKED